jgi:hypothetical protein
MKLELNPVLRFCFGFFLFACLSVTQGLYASDNAGNYNDPPGWKDGDNQGTGFGAWNLVQVNGGWFLGDPSFRASNLAGLVTSGKTFSLYASGFVDAVRSFEPALATNDRFKISLGYHWNNGNRGFSLLNGTTEILNFNINDQGMTWTGGGSHPTIAWDGKRVNGIQVDITIIKTANGFRFAITSPQESGINGVGSVITSGVTSFKIYVSGSGGDSGGDLNFNNLLLDSVPGDVTPPVITLNGDKLIQVPVGGVYTPPNPAVTVLDDVTNTANIVVTTSLLDTSTAGLKTITYTARDEANNEETITRVVLVGDLTATTTDTFYNLHSPATLTLNPTTTSSVYGQIYLKGATQVAGQAPNVQAWIGVNSANTDPTTWDSAAWISAIYNSGQIGNNDEYSRSLAGADYTAGNTYYYATRWQVGAGVFAYGGTSGAWNGTSSVNGVLSVVPVRDVTFAVDMSVQISKGDFVPSSGQAVELKGNYNSDWMATGIPMTDLDGDGIYTVTLPVQGNPGTAFEYKFTVTGSGSAGLAWEGGLNRSLFLGSSPEATPLVTFGNDGTTFAVWSGGAILNSENLAKYVVGGASGPNAQVEAPTVGRGFIVPNHYTYIETLVRTDDNNLTIIGESTTNLNVGFSSAGTWTVEGSAQGVSQLNAPPGCERKKFIYWHGIAQEKMFLRLKATLAP